MTSLLRWSLRHSRDQDAGISAKHRSLTGEKPSADEGSRRSVQFVACGCSFQTAQAQVPQSGEQALPVSVLSRQPPEILSGARVTFDGVMPQRRQLPLQRKTALGQHAHRPERDGGKTDSTAEQGAVAIAQVLA